jgi:hypothetical protein
MVLIVPSCNRLAHRIAQKTQYGYMKSIKSIHIYIGVLTQVSPLASGVLGATRLGGSEDAVYFKTNTIVSFNRTYAQ